MDVSDYDVVFTNGEQYITIDHDGGITIERGAFNEFADGSKLLLHMSAPI